MGTEFRLCQGVDAENLQGIRSAYCLCDNRISAVLSAELLLPAAEKAVKLLKAPLFFFLELPCTEQEEKKLRKSNSDPLHYNVYYLDGCTADVAAAILKRYGELLVSDGISRFGFGSHETGEEIYFLYYQEVCVYGDPSRYEGIFKDLGASRENKLVTLWDNFSQETPGSRICVEVDGETVYDIRENLEPEGMYLANTSEDE
ncbi:MAG: hypothetical protein J5994_00925 [Ruminococcus sp.]|nr:hypothetical protein [Ruminococcus sp.]